MTLGKNRSWRSTFFLFFSALLLSFSGYVEQSFLDHSSELRAIAIIAFSLLVFFISLVFIKKIQNIGFFHILLVFFMLYGSIVGVLRGNIIEIFSPFFRLFLFLMVSLLVYNFLKSDKHFTQRAIAIFLGWCSFFIVVQTFYEVIIGGGIFMNNAVRYYGSITSPIGFASLAFTLLCGLGYCWVLLGGRLKFLLLLGLVWVVLMTSTRSISAMSFLVMWLLIVFRLQLGMTFLWLAVTPLLGWGAIIALQDVGVWERIVSTVNDAELDGSSSFRVFILDNFFMHLDAGNLFFGLGLGYFHVWFQSVTSVPGVAPHFEWLWILSEFGLILFLIYMAYGLSYLVLSFYKWQAGQIDRCGFLIVIFFSMTPQFFLQLANPFYFYQVVIVFGIIAGIALNYSELANFKIFGKVSL